MSTRRDLAHLDCHVALAAQHVARRGRNLAGGQDAGRDLVEQRREQVMVVALDERDVDFGPLQLFDREQAREAAADDRHAMAARRRLPVRSRESSRRVSNRKVTARTTPRLAGRPAPARAVAAPAARGGKRPILSHASQKPPNEADRPSAKPAAPVLPWGFGAGRVSAALAAVDGATGRRTGSPQRRRVDGAEHGEGLTTLPDGRLLRDALLDDPEGWLGAAHAAALRQPTPRCSSNCSTQASACRCTRTRRDSSPAGTWAAAAARPRPGSSSRLVAATPAFISASLAISATPSSTAGAQTQDARAMLACMHALDVEPGDAVLVPAGLPHAIGAGIFCLELQEPTDFSVMLEWDGFDLDPDAAGLGLEPAVARDCVQRAAMHPDRLEDLRVRAAVAASSSRERARALPAARPSRSFGPSAFGPGTLLITLTRDSRCSSCWRASGRSRVSAVAR